MMRSESHVGVETPRGLGTPRHTDTSSCTRRRTWWADFNRILFSKGLVCPSSRFLSSLPEYARCALWFQVFFFPSSKRKEQRVNRSARKQEKMQIHMWHEEYEPSAVWRRVPHVPRQASEGVNAVAKCVQQKEERPGEDRPRHPTGCQGDPEG